MATEIALKRVFLEPMLRRLTGLDLMGLDSQLKIDDFKGEEVFLSVAK